MMCGPANVKVTSTLDNKTHKFIPSALCWADIFNCVMHVKWKILRIIYISCDTESAGKLSISYFYISSGPFTVWTTSWQPCGTYGPHSAFNVIM